MELLAPAGNLEILKIAIEAGCDAVYISGKNYGARKSADNFTLAELQEGVKFAHLRKKLVYVTVNTLIYDDEFKELHTYLDFLDQIKVDAVIVQDLGLIHYIRKNFPNIIIHASTQLNINSINGAKALQKLGVKRVVLARETPLEIVSEIVKTGIEVEVFAHGALCFSCSGQCYMSYQIGRRSGNRGECAQPCRKKYQLTENGKPISDFVSLMSMKDLNVLDYLEALKKINVTSLKIEGRLKSASYVSTVVRIYRNHLSGISKRDDYKELSVAFNRKFTKGYMFKEKNNQITNQQTVNHQGFLIGKVLKVTKEGILVETSDLLEVKDGIRIIGKNELGFYISRLEKRENGYFIFGKFNVSVSSLVYKTVSVTQQQRANSYLENEVYKYHLKATLTILLNQELTLKLENEKYKIEVKTKKLEEIAQNIIADERIKEQIKKTGDLLFSIDDIEIITDNKAFVRIKEINEIRRIAIDKFIKVIIDSYQLQKNSLYPYKESINCNNHKFNNIIFDFVVHNDEQYKWCLDNGFNQVYLVNQDKGGFRYNRHLNFNNNFYQGLVHNLGEMKEEFIYSPYSNVLNQNTLELFNWFNPKVVYLSNELSKAQCLRLGDVATNYEKGVFLYGRMLLLVSHHCFISATKKISINCQNCKKNKYYIFDEYHNKMMVHASCNQNGPELLLYDYHLTNRFNDLIEYYQHNINHFMIVITDETKDELESIKKIIRKVVQK